MADENNNIPVSGAGSGASTPASPSPAVPISQLGSTVAAASAAATPTPGSLTGGAPVAPGGPSSSGIASPPRRPKFPVRTLMLGIGGIAILVTLLVYFLFLRGRDLSGVATQPASQLFPVTDVPLSEFAESGEVSIDPNQQLTVNGVLKLNNALVVGSVEDPQNPQKGMFYYNDASNQLRYYNGTEFVNILSGSSPSAGVGSIGGASGDIGIGGGLTVAGGTLSNTGVTSIQGQTGAVSLSAGGGIAISGTTITNTGVRSLVVAPGDPSLTITNDGNGNLQITQTQTSDKVLLAPSTAQTDASSNPSIFINKTGSGNLLQLSTGSTPVNRFVVDNNGAIAVGTIDFNQVTGKPTFVNSLGGATGTVSLGGGLQVSGNTLSNTGVLSLSGTANQIAFSASTGIITASLPQNIATNSSVQFGQLTLSTALAPAYGGTGRTGDNTVAAGKILIGNGTSSYSLKTLTGSGNITVDISDPDNVVISSTFSCTPGCANTKLDNLDAATAINQNLLPSGDNLRDLGSASAAFRNLFISNSITPNAAMTVGATTQNLTLQGAATQLTGNTVSLVSGSGGNTTTLSFTSPTAARTISLPDNSGTVAVAGSSNIAISSAGVVSLTGTIPVGNGGTGLNTAPTNGQLLIGNNGNYSLGTLTAGAGINITNAAGSITIATDGSGCTTSTCATRELNNLQNVAINADLKPGVAGAVDLGTNALPFGDLFLAGTSTTPGAGQHFKFTGAATAARTLTLQDISGTIALVQTAGSSVQQIGDINVSGTVIAPTFQGNTFKSADVSSGSSGAVSLQTGDAGTGTSGNLTIDVGTGTGGKGNINIGTTNASTITIGHNGATPGKVLIQGTGGTVNDSAFKGWSNDGSAVTTLYFDTVSGNADVAIPNITGTMAVIQSGSTEQTGNLRLTGNVYGTGMQARTAAGTLQLGASTNTFQLRGLSSPEAGTGGNPIVTENSVIQVFNAAGTSSTKILFGNPTANVRYIFPTATAGDYEVCTNAGNCNGAGSSVTATGYNANRFTYFTNSSNQITASALEHTDADTITLLGNTSELIVRGGLDSGDLGSASLTLGTASSRNGAIALHNSSNANTVTLESGITTSSYTLKLPTALGTTGDCLSLGAGGQLTYKACITSGGGGGGSGVTTDGGTTNFLTRWTDGGNSKIGDSIIQDNGSRVGINVAPSGVVGEVLTVGTAAAFKVTNAGALTAAGITNSSGGITNTGGINNNNSGITNTGSLGGVTTLTATGLLQTSASSDALTLSGAPTADATKSLLRIGNAIAGGNAVTNGGTYIGLNAPSSGAGSAADFLNFQQNGVQRFKVDNSGNITAGEFNGVVVGEAANQFTITGGTGTARTLTITGNSTINQNLSTTSSPQFSALTLTGTPLAPGSGGTGNVAPSASLFGALLIAKNDGTYNIARLTSNDSSVTITNATSGNIDLAVSSCSSCANTSLSNLDSVAIGDGDHLAPANAGMVNLGTSTKPFGELFISGTSGTAATNNFKITGVATGGQKTLTLDNLSGTIALVQAGSPSAQTGGLSVTGQLASKTAVFSGDGAQMTLSDTSTGALTLISASNNQTTFTGNLLDLSSDTGTGVASRFRVEKDGDTIIGGALTVNTIAQAGGTDLVIGTNNAGEDITLQGATITFKNETGAGIVTYQFDTNDVAGTYQICTNSGNCAGTGGGVTTSGGAANIGFIPYYNQAQNIVRSPLYYDNANNFMMGTTSAPSSVGSRLVIKGTTNNSTASALNVTNQSDSSLLYVRNDGNVGIGLGDVTTAPPEQKLDIAGTTQVRRTGTATSGSTAFNSNILQLQSSYWDGGAAQNVAVKIQNEVVSPGSGTYNLTFKNNGNQLMATMTNDGRFGVGNITPVTNAALDVAGAFNLRATSCSASAVDAGIICFDGTEFKVSEDGGGFVDLVTSSSNAFVNGGNAFGGLATIGTTDSNPLAFKTANAEVGRWHTNGRLGINTSADALSARLQVRGEGNTSGTFGLLVQSGGVTPAAILAVRDDGRVGVGNTAPGALLGVGTNSEFTVDNSGNIATSGTFSSSNATNAAFTLTGAPPANAAQSLIRLGSNNISSGSANGNYIGANPSAFTGNWMQFEVGSQTRLSVSAAGTITAAGDIVLSTGNSNISSGALNTDIRLNANGSGKVKIGGDSTGDVEIGGGSGSTGCTIANSTGNISCTGTVNGATITGGSHSSTAINGLGVNNGDLTDNQINFTGTAAANTAIVQFGTTALNSSTALIGTNNNTSANFVDFQQSNTSVFRVSNTGAATFGSTLTVNSGGAAITGNSSVTGTFGVSSTATFSATGAVAIAATGSPLANASTSLVQIGSAITGGSSSGTYLGMNAASGFTGNLMDLQLNGAQRFTVTNAGNTSIAGTLAVTGAATFTSSISANGGTISTASNQLRFSGAARNDKNITIPAEYVGAALASDGTDNIGTMTSGFDSGSRQNYYSWTTAQSTAQDYDIVVVVPIPSDWDSWNSGSMSFNVCASNNSASAITATITKTDGTVAANGVNIANTSGGASPCTTFTTTTATMGTDSGYTAGQSFTVRLRLTSPQNGDIRIGTINVGYKSKF